MRRTIVSHTIFSRKARFPLSDYFANYRLGHGQTNDTYCVNHGALIKTGACMNTPAELTKIMEPESHG
jgi:hypothetical protein